MTLRMFEEPVHEAALPGARRPPLSAIDLSPVDRERDVWDMAATARRGLRAIRPA